MDPWAGRSGDSTLEQLQSDPDNFVPSTAPFDPRFPTTNQTRNCWTNYVDHLRCVRARGADYPPCKYFERVYRALCPSAWVEAWDEQVRERRFPCADL